jgi:hypothetical protein
MMKVMDRLPGTMMDREMMIPDSARARMRINPF